MQRIGIFSGTFDPIHKGHLAFALQAIAAAKLDKVFFMLEAKPRRKEGITHYSHRLAMLRLALKPYRKLDILEVPDKQFSVNKTMPRLLSILKDDQLFLLLGSDAVQYICNLDDWPNAGAMLKKFGLVIGLRGGGDKKTVLKSLSQVGHEISELEIIDSTHQHASSKNIREGIGSGKKPEDLLKGISDYVDQHWLYQTVAGSSNKS